MFCHVLLLQWGMSWEIFVGRLRWRSCISGPKHAGARGEVYSRNHPSAILPWPPTPNMEETSSGNPPIEGETHPLTGRWLSLGWNFIFIIEETHILEIQTYCLSFHCKVIQNAFDNRQKKVTWKLEGKWPLATSADQPSGKIWFEVVVVEEDPQYLGKLHCCTTTSDRALKYMLKFKWHFFVGFKLQMSS